MGELAITVDDVGYVPRDIGRIEEQRFQYGESKTEDQTGARITRCANSYLWPLLNRIGQQSHTQSCTAFDISRQAKDEATL